MFCVLYIVSRLVHNVKRSISESGGRRNLPAGARHEAVTPARPIPGSRRLPFPAQDEIAGRIDLNRDLVKHPLATFYVRVEGDSMEPRIHSGELLVVDRMVETKDGDIVVARLGQEFTVKRLHTEEDGSIWLV